jgi:valyl-tRNA synthetase
MEKLFDYKKAAARWNEKWEKAGIFTPDLSSSSTPFVIILPPPNVTGILTVGHILGNTIQDALVRRKKMLGFNTLWLPGFDHAGIATQKVVELELAKQGKKRAEMTREEFISSCWKWKEEYQARILKQLKSLGCALDWTRQCFTLDEKRSKAVRKVFVHLYEKGLVYRGDYIVNWCPACSTAISDEEVEFKERDSFLYWIKYPLEDGSHVTVATTRPETMLGDTAVGVSTKDEEKKRFVGKTAVLPLVGRKLPIIADDAVDPEFGSGFVKVTPAHDPNDFLFAERHDLPFVVVIDRRGRMAPDTAGKFAGLDRFEARRRIVEELDSLGLLEKVEPYKHSVGHHDRCKTIIEPLLSKEWFVSMKPLAEPAIACVERGEIDFYPPRWRNVYLSWMREIRDWCVSRRLWWGHRIPVWYCPEGHLTVSVEDPEACATCGNGSLEQDENVLDTWFSSWLWTFTPMGWPEKTKDLELFHPTTVLVTGFDIIFFWVARMIMASLEFMGEIPFRHVFLTGIVRDTKGRKMSKSLGNSPDPLDIIDRYGADAFRFTMAMLSPPGHDVYFAEEKVEVGRNFVNKIWQASRMILAAHEEHGEGVPGRGTEATNPFAKSWKDEFGSPPAFEPLLEWEDRWILGALDSCIEDVHEKFESWRINEAAGRLYEFFWHEFCDWYLELVKTKLYGDGDKRTCIAVLLYVLAESLKLLHPFMPYVTEELWDKLPMTSGLLLEQEYPARARGFRDESVARDMELFKSVATAARNLRAQYGVKPSASIRLLIRTPGEGSVEIGRMVEGFKRLVRADVVEFGPEISKGKGCASTPVGEYEVVVPLEGLADFEAEIRRLEKEKSKLQSAYASVKKKLSNKNFLSKAKAEVVKREEERRALLEAEMEKIEESLRILQDM